MKIPTYDLKLIPTGEVHECHPISTPNDIVSVLQDYIGNFLQESLVVVSFNTRNIPIGMSIVSLGSIDRTIAVQADIVRPVLLHGSNKFLLAHNHPTGDTSPSEDDKVLTEKVVKTAELLDMVFLDHVIVGPNENWTSLREETNIF